MYMSKDEPVEGTNLPTTTTSTFCGGGDWPITQEDEDAVQRCGENHWSADAASIWGLSDRDLAICSHLWSVPRSYFDTHFQPFLGHGYFFWPYCYNRGWKRAVLGDIDQRVIDIHDLLKNSPEQILARLSSMPVPGVRQRPPFQFDNVDDSIGKIAQFARTGAWLDVNRRLDAELRRSFEREVRKLENKRITACSDTLNEYTGIEILRGDFAETVKSAVAGDFAFFDLPSRFSPDEHVRVATCIRDLHERGVICAVAMPVCKEVAELYAGFEIRDVLGPMPKPKRRSRKTKTVEVLQRPILAQIAIGRRG